MSKQTISYLIRRWVIKSQIRAIWTQRLFLVREKLEEEMKAKQEEFEKEKQKFAEENPEMAAQLDDTQLMDGNNDPQFKAIFDVQNHIQVRSSRQNCLYVVFAH